jgi:hypothetical protein
MKIVKIAQAHYKSPITDDLSPNQLRAIIVKEILVFPGKLPIINEARIKEALKKLKALKDRGEIKEHVGNMILEAIDSLLFVSKSPEVLKLKPEEKTAMSENALHILSKLMKQVVEGK